MRKPYWANATATLYLGDAVDVIREMPCGSVDCVIVSPSLIRADAWRENEVGDAYTRQQSVRCLRRLLVELRRVLAADGTVWIHFADATGNGGGSSPFACTAPRHRAFRRDRRGMPWQVTELHRAGWVILGIVDWDRSHEMPGPASPRTAAPQETIFLLAKRPRCLRMTDSIGGSTRWFGHPSCRRLGRIRRRRCGSLGPRIAAACHGKSYGEARSATAHSLVDTLADAWTSPPARFRRPRFDVLPVDIAARCIAAGCRADGTVLDLYAGGGTVGIAARRLGCTYIGIDARPGYLAVATRRLRAASCEGGAA